MVRQNQFFLIKDRKNASEVLKFIYIHQAIIVDILSLATVQANIWHLKLVVKILHFLYDALRYYAEWNMEDPTSFTNILVCFRNYKLQMIIMFFTGIYKTSVEFEYWSYFETKNSGFYTR